MAKLKISRGTTYSRRVTYKKDGVITPVTGMSVYFTIKSVESDLSAADESAILAKTMEDLSGDDAAAGVFTVIVWPYETNSLEAGEYFYDIKICENPTADPGAKYIYKLEEGTIVLDASPTNRAV